MSTQNTKLTYNMYIKNKLEDFQNTNTLQRYENFNFTVFAFCTLGVIHFFFGKYSGISVIK